MSVPNIAVEPKAARSLPYLRFRRRLITGLALMAALAVAVVVGQFRASYLERDQAMRSQTEHYVKAMEAHVVYSIQFIDLSLLGFANAIKMLPAKQDRSSEIITTLISSRASTFTNDYWINFIDAKGVAVATSSLTNNIGVSYADRDYFKVHVNNSMHGQLFIGEPAIGRASKQRLFYMSRRVEGPKGEFLGVIVAPLNAARYADVFENSRFSPDVSIALVHGGGKVIARVPEFTASFMQDVGSTALFDHIKKAASGTYKTVNSTDRLSRIVSYRALQRLPLVITVESSDAEASRILEKNSLIAGAGLALLLLLMLTGGHFSLRTYTRQEERELRYRALYASSREMEEKLYASEQRVLLIADNLPIVIAYIDRDERYTFTNRKFDQVLNTPPQASIGKKVRSVVTPHIYAQSEPYLRRALNGEPVYFERHAVGKKNGWDGVTYVPDKSDNGQINGMFIMVEDITQRKKSEESMKLTALLYQNTSQGMLVTDAEGRILTVNPAFSLLSGYAEHEVVGHYAYEMTSGREDIGFYSRMSASIRQTGQWEGELWHQNKAGDYYLLALRFNTVPDKNGRPIRYVALFSDITKKKASEELIWKQANFDALTGLPNRRMFHEHLRLEMKKTDRSRLPMALVFVDLDHFKEVNDNLGHDKGDLLLKEVARRLSHAVRGTDTVARLGGDEFTVILSELNNPGDVVRIAQAILTQMNTPFNLGEHVAHISSSLGITLYPEDGRDADTLLQNADQAMYAAKQQGRNRFNYFAPFMQEATRVRISLANELRVAVERQELRVLYQPIVDLATGKICKAEALVRWQHPSRGLLNPADFISIAESSGMIVSIGDWVFEQAARLAKRLQLAGLTDFQISVNKSALQFRDDGSNYRQWLELLAALQLASHSIIIEVTENLLLDTANAVSERMLALQHAHMQISLDDFGTGYCSVAFLKRYNIDYIKIDPSFISTLADNRDSIVLCEAIIAMAHKLGIKVIAEGIETQQQLQALQAGGCDLGQGFLFSVPVSGEELEKQACAELTTVDN